MRGLIILSLFLVVMVLSCITTEEQGYFVYEANAYDQYGPGFSYSDEPPVMTVCELVILMKSKDRATCLGAIEDLGLYGPDASEAIAPLINALSDSRTYVNSRAAEILGKITCEPRVIEAIIDLFQEEYPESWVGAGKGLGRMGIVAKAAEPFAFLNLNHSDGMVRQGAAAAMSGVEPWPEVIPLLIERFNTGDGTGALSYAASALGSCGSDASSIVPDLIEHMRTGSWNKRWQAAQAVGAIGPPATDAIPILIDLLNDEHENPRYAAIAALARMGPLAKDAVKLIAQFLKDPDPDFRAIAATALSCIGADSVAVMPELLAALRDNDDRVRAWSCSALGEIGSPAIPGLLKALESNNFFEAYWAAESFGYMGPEAKGAVDILIEKFTQLPPPYNYVLAMSLAQIGPEPGVVEALVSASESGNRDLAAAAISGLPILGPEPKVLSALDSCLDNDDAAIRCTAALAIVHLGPAATGSRDKLMELALYDPKKLDDGVYPVRAAAKVALSAIESRYKHYAMLGDENPWVRRYAALTLRNIGGDAACALPVLIRLAAYDPDENVRTAASESIERIWSEINHNLYSALTEDDVKYLTETLQDPAPLMQIEALVLLGKLGEDKAGAAVPSIISLVGTDNTLVAATAANVLSAFSDKPQVITVLTQALVHDSYLVRANAAYALWRIGPKGAAALSKLQQLADGDPNGNVRALAILAVESM